MNAFPCLVTRAEKSARLRIDSRAELVSACEVLLAAEMRNALTRSPGARVSTPNLNGNSTPAADVIADQFAGTSGAESLMTLLTLVGMAARGFNVKTQALAWIAERAEEHARFYAADQADLLTEADAADAAELEVA